MSFDVTLTTMKNGQVITKPLFRNMPEADAVKVAERMNRLNTLAAKNIGKAFNFLFLAVKNGK